MHISILEYPILYYKILYASYRFSLMHGQGLLKTLEIVQVPLISNKNNECFTWKLLYMCDIIFFRTRKVLDRVAEKIRTQIIFWLSFSLKSRRLWDSAENYYRVGYVTDDNITERMRFAFCIIKATRKHARTHARTQTCSQNMKYLLPIHGNSGYANVPLYYFHKYRVIRNDCRGFNNLSYTIQLR